MPDVETITPSSLKEALIAKARKNVVAVAGGTDLLVGLYDILDKPWPRLLLLGRIKALHDIKDTDGEIKIGPLVTFSQIERSKVLRRYAPQLVEAATLAGSVQIRNMATIGGNIANASPAGDLIPPLYALGGRLQLSSTKGKRQINIEDFFRGPGATVLKSDELITRIIVRKAAAHGFFLRLAARRALAISKVSVAASVLIREGKVKEAKIALGAVAPTVIRARACEDYLRGKEFNPDNIARAGEIARRESRPINDIRSDAEYRREMVRILINRGLTQILQSSKHGA
jgi:CO/xanthine dehydrogenase FAD-binding subunit